MVGLYVSKRVDTGIISLGYEDPSPPSRSHLLKVPQPPQITSLSGDYVFKHRASWDISHPNCNNIFSLSRELSEG